MKTGSRNYRARQQMQRVEGQQSRLNFQRRELDPHQHRCTERTIDYGVTEHSCRVCGRTWRITPQRTIPPTEPDALPRILPASMSCFPITPKKPPLREGDA